MLKFATPFFLWLLLLLPAFVYWDYRRNKKSALLFSDITTIKKTFRSWDWLDLGMTGLRTLVLVLLIMGLARPQKIIQQQPLYRSGVDMMILLDASGSMAAEDLSGGRLNAAKQIVKDFILRRPNDRLGLVVFGVSAVTKAPLTFDSTMLVNVIDRVKVGEAGDATAIGQALVVGLNRLRGSIAKSKVIILVTDGENNAGSIGPLEAAKLAADMQVKIYTIGIGSPEGSPMIVYDPHYGKQIVRNPDGSPVLTKLNVDDLVKIADTTGGRFYQAKNTQQLTDVFTTIDSLEKVKLKSDVSVQTEDVFAGFVFLALLLMLLEFILRYTLLRNLPCIS
jgi:Ca-activated chloride channel family protein